MIWNMGLDGGGIFRGVLFLSAVHSAGSFTLWLEELEKTTLKVKQKAEHWSESITCPAVSRCGVVGYACADKEGACWGEGATSTKPPCYGSSPAG